MVYNRDLKYDAMGGEREKTGWWWVVTGESSSGYLFSDHCFVASREKILRVEYFAVKFLRFVANFTLLLYLLLHIITSRTHISLFAFSMALRHFNFTTRALKEQRCTWGDRLPANLTRINDFLRWEGKSQVNYHFIISKRTERWKIRVNFDRGWRWMRTEFL